MELLRRGVDTLWFCRPNPLTSSTAYCWSSLEAPPNFRGGVGGFGFFFFFFLVCCFFLGFCFFLGGCSGWEFFCVGVWCVCVGGVLGGLWVVWFFFFFWFGFLVGVNFTFLLPFLLFPLTLNSPRVGSLFPVFVPVPRHRLSIVGVPPPFFLTSPFHPVANAVGPSPFFLRLLFFRRQLLSLRIVPQR